jgi:hypothetical protein
MMRFAAAYAKGPYASGASGYFCWLYLAMNSRPPGSFSQGAPSIKDKEPFY